jgi:hypothetical protein
MFKAIAALSFALGASVVVAQKQGPLTEQIFPYTAIPYQVNPFPVGRGPQSGYNLCNSTTQNQNSMCQTSMVNSIDDFCLWGPPVANSTIGDEEADVVAWCTKPGRGTRVIPPGALTGVQFTKTPGYLQVTGHINQVAVDMNAQDEGGELDPHGADLLGNPLGGLMYSNGFPSNGGNNNTFQQVIQWTNFMGGNIFCIKVCDPAGPDSVALCLNTYDLLGCTYNAPNDYTDDSFTTCDADNMIPVGTYVSNGVTSTYKQPAGGITASPYTPSIPASSNCVTFASSDLYAPALSYFSGSSFVAPPTTSAAVSAPTGTGAATHPVFTPAGATTTSSSTTGTSTSNASPAQFASPLSASFWVSTALILGGVAFGAAAL